MLNKLSPKSIILKIKYCFVRKWVSPKGPEPSGWPDDEPAYSDIAHYEYSFTAKSLSNIGKFIEKNWRWLFEILITLALLFVTIMLLRK
jgi:hypothetical protein